MRHFTLPALAFLGFCGIATVARADCCDDALSCIGAVVTDGLSCEIESIIDTVKALQTTVQTLTSDLTGKTGDMIVQARSSISQQADDVRQVREQSTTSLNQAIQKSRELVDAKRILMNSVLPKQQQPETRRESAGAQPLMTGRVAGPAVAPLFPPADPGSIKDALSRANDYVQELQNGASARYGQIQQAEKSSVDAAARHVPSAQQIGVQLVLAPLQAVGNALSDLLRNPERIFDPSAEINAQIQAITDQVPALLLRIVTEVTQEAKGDLDNVQGPLQEVQDSAAAGTTVVNAMDKVSSTRLQRDLDALNRLLPLRQVSASKNAARALVLPPGVIGRHEIIVAAFARAEPSKLPLVVQRKAAVNDIAAKWEAIKAKARVPPQVDKARAQKVEHDVSQMFAGKKGPELEKKKQDLLTEAAKRFANQPKTLEKVRQYIEGHARG